MNIVFDLGGVVFNWQPDAIVRSVFQDTATQALVKQEIFEHTDWVALDRGSMSLDRATERAMARTGLSRQHVTTLFDAVPRHLTPIDGMFELIRALNDADNRLYVLSNMHAASIDYLEQEHRIWELFEGAVISCRVKQVKPERGIYRHLLDTYQLTPVETVFVDDMPENLAAASSMGITTVQYFDPDQCRQALVGLDCI